MRWSETQSRRRPQWRRRPSVPSFGSWSSSLVSSDVLLGLFWRDHPRKTRPGLRTARRLCMPNGEMRFHITGNQFRPSHWRCQRACGARVAPNQRRDSSIITARIQPTVCSLDQLGAALLPSCLDAKPQTQPRLSLSKDGCAPMPWFDPRNKSEGRQAHHTGAAQARLRGDLTRKDPNAHRYAAL